MYFADHRKSEREADAPAFTDRHGVQDERGSLRLAVKEERGSQQTDLAALRIAATVSHTLDFMRNGPSVALPMASRAHRLRFLRCPTAQDEARRPAISSSSSMSERVERLAPR